MHVTDRMARYTPPKPQVTVLPPEEDTMDKPPSRACSWIPHTPPPAPVTSTPTTA